jgi:xanthine dehydrogenase iron-sulfur cluster and FAD-binding subunit A
MWEEYINASNVNNLLEVLDQRGSDVRIVAGATDLILEMERGIRKGVKTLVDITRLGPEFGRITLDDQKNIHIGPLVTHNQCAASKLIRENAYPLARACWEVGSPQIRNRGTIAGNIITGSPANDSISPLMALDAHVILQSKKKGQRDVPLNQFYSGVRRTVMAPDEMLVDIYFPQMPPNYSGTFIKYALRKAQAISVVNVSVILQIEKGIIQKAKIAIGAVTPIVSRAKEAEDALVGIKISDRSALEQAVEKVINASTPISDIRSSNDYRRHILKIITLRAIDQIYSGEKDLPEAPVLLAGVHKTAPIISDTTYHTHDQAISTTINGKKYDIASGQHKTLLRLLREDLGLIGTKEGCAEGECGACTVFLDGAAVMACMVPAPRAHGAEIVTIEGIGSEDTLHPVQEAFIKDGAVQCGYCTPGFIMSAVKLLEENPEPSHDQVKQAITGNLCRCTGYYKIIRAIEDAALQMQGDEK